MPKAGRCGVHSGAPVCRTTQPPIRNRHWPSGIPNRDSFWRLDAARWQNVAAHSNYFQFPATRRISHCPRFPRRRLRPGTIAYDRRLRYLRPHPALVRRTALPRAQPRDRGQRRPHDHSRGRGPCPGTASRERGFRRLSRCLIPPSEVSEDVSDDGESTMARRAGRDAQSGEETAEAVRDENVRYRRYTVATQVSPCLV